MDPIEAFALGRQIAQQKIDQQQREIDRQMQRDVMKHQLAQMKLEDKLKSWDVQRKATLQNVDLMGQQPGASFPAEAFQPPNPMEEQVRLDENGQVPQGKLNTVTLPGFSEGGMNIPPVTVQPKTKEQQLAEHLAALWTDMRLKAAGTPGNIAAGGARVIPGVTPGTTETITGPALQERPGAAEARAETARHNRALEAITAGGRGDADARAREARAAAEARDIAADEQAATTWQQNQYAVLEQRIRQGYPTVDKDGLVTKYTPMTPEQIAQEKRRIEDGYKALRPKKVTNGAPKADTKLAAAVPSDVSTLLKGKAAGTYKLRDATGKTYTYVVGADGTIK